MPGPSSSQSLATAKIGVTLPTPVPFGKYYLLEKIATGGMAEVFKAKTFGVEGFERLLAVKKILSSIAEDTEFISMFIDEAKIAGRLNHANIAQIFDLGKADGSYFIALEYVSGQDGRAIFERCRREGRKLGIDMVCYIMMKVCEGLDYAHNKTDSLGNPLNIVHRDVSPQNVLVSYEGEVKLIDFGIAKAAGKSTQTQVGILKGKFSYMSPEQVRGLSLDRRSDIFSASIVLYELLTLERLFLGESDFETLEKIRKVEVAPPSLYNPHIPKELEDIVLTGLAKDPNRRFQTAHEMQEALQKFMFNQPFYFTNKDLAARMREMFHEDLDIERGKLEYYQTLDLETIRYQTGETESPNVLRGTGNESDLYWDEDEVATTVWTDRPDDDLDLIEYAEFEEEEDDLWPTPIEPPGGQLPPPSPPIGGDDAEAAAMGPPPTPAAAEELGDFEDAWERIAAVEPDAAKVLDSADLSQTLPKSLPSGIYPAHKKSRSAVPWLVGLVLLALAIGASAAFVFWPSEGDIEIVFRPTPSDVQIHLGDLIIHDGETPWTYQDAEPGTYELTILADGYERMTGEVELAAGGEYEIEWALIPVDESPGPVVLKSSPAGAAVWLDGVDTGLRTPDELEDLDRGVHTVRLERDGFLPFERDVTVGDAPVEIDAELLAEQFRLIIRTDVDDAEFWLSDQATGQELHSGELPASLDNLDGALSYLLIVEADGYTRFTSTVEPSSLPERTVEAALLPRDGEEPAGDEVASAEVAASETDETDPDEGDDASAERDAAARDDEAVAERSAPDDEDEETEAERRRREERERAREERRAREREEREAREREEREARERAEREARADEEEREPVIEIRDESAEEDDQEVASTDPGFLSVQSRPAARVFINGDEVGFTPIRNHELRPGRYTVRLVNEEFGLDYEETVRISTGERRAVLYRQD